MIRPSRHRRAVATAFALITLGLVAAALSAGALLLRQNVRRTVWLRTDAQLRQLLLFGAADAGAHLKTWGNVVKGEDWSPKLPPDLERQGAGLNLESRGTPAHTLTVHITATLAGRQAIEDLQFHLSANHWQLADIQLGPISAVHVSHHAR